MKKNEGLGLNPWRMGVSGFDCEHDLFR